MGLGSLFFLHVFFFLQEGEQVETHVVGFFFSFLFSREMRTGGEDRNQNIFFFLFICVCISVLLVP